MDNLGNKIKKERIKNNLKQSQLAKILCVNRVTGIVYIFSRCNKIKV